MRKLPIAAAIASLLVLGAAAGPSLSAPGQGLEPATRTICLDVGGELRAATCRADASRLDKRDIICLCGDAQTVQAPVCDRGEKPIAENRTYELARKEAARDGNLIGDTFEGRRMCVQARNS